MSVGRPGSSGMRVLAATRSGISSTVPRPGGVVVALGLDQDFVALVDLATSNSSTSASILSRSRLQIVTRREPGTAISPGSTWVATTTPSMVEVTLARPRPVGLVQPRHRPPSASPPRPGGHAGYSRDRSGTGTARSGSWSSSEFGLIVDEIGVSLGLPGLGLGQVEAEFVRPEPMRTSPLWTLDFSATRTARTVPRSQLPELASAPGLATIRPRR